MIHITDKTKCSGCSACVAICPCNIISMKEDAEGFVYPVVQEEDCIECSLCNRVCTLENPPEIQENPMDFYAACLKNTSELDQVSSGGVCWALSQHMIQSGGVVYGAVQTAVDTIMHLRAETMEDIQGFRKSKYLQSTLTDCYPQIKNDLKAGKKVLFTGTPCQAAAVKQYIGDHPQLITCDIVCHGVPSIKAFRKWKKETEEIEGADITNIVYRDKTYGYHKNHYAVTFSNGNVIKEPSVSHAFHRCYLEGLMYRPACGVCPFASLPRVSDITVADYWKYEGDLKNKNNNKGVSLVVCSSGKGNEFFKACTDFLDIEDTEKEKALDSCRHLTHNPMEHKMRKEFFEILNDEGYYAAIKKCGVIK